MRYPYFRKHPNIVTKMPLNPLPSIKKESVPSYILRRQLWPACFFGGGTLPRFSHSKLEDYTFFEVKTITQSPAFLALGWKKKHLFTALSESCNICHLLGSHAKRNHFIFQPSNRLCWKVSFREGDPCNFTNHPPKNIDKRQWDWRTQPRWASPDTSPNSPPFFYIQMLSEMCLFVGSPRILLRFLARVKTHDVNRNC